MHLSNRKRIARTQFIAVLLGAGLLAFMASAWAATGDTKAQAAAFATQGDRYRQTGQIDSAIVQFRQAVKLDPTVSAPFVALGDLLTEKGDYSKDDTTAIKNYREAAAAYRQVAKIQSRYPDVAAIYLGNANADEQKIQALNKGSGAMPAAPVAQNTTQVARNRKGQTADDGTADVQRSRQARAGGDNSAAMEILQKSVAENKPVALLELCEIYDNGAYGVSKNGALALQLCGQAAAQNYAEAERQLGFMYLIGRSVTKDDAQAVNWFKKAINDYAKIGTPEDEARISYLYDMSLKGLDGFHDPKLAFQWEEKAAMQGYVPAERGLAEMYDRGDGVDKDIGQSINWYKKVIDTDSKLGTVDAEKEISSIYEFAPPGLQDKQLAFQWLEKAAEQGDHGAVYDLAARYRDGDGVSKNPAEAINWFKKLVDQGDANAASTIATIYSVYANDADGADNKSQQIQYLLQKLQWDTKAANLEPTSTSYQRDIKSTRLDIAFAYNFAGVDSYNHGNYSEAADEFVQASRYNDPSYSDAAQTLQSKISQNLQNAQTALNNQNSRNSNNNNSSGGGRTFGQFLGSVAGPLSQALGAYSQGQAMGNAISGGGSGGGGGGGNSDLCRQLLQLANQSRQEQNDMSTPGAGGGGRSGQAGRLNDAYNNYMSQYHANHCG